MADPAANLNDKTFPAENAFDAWAVRSDGSDLPIFTRAIYTGSGGAIKITTVGGNTVTLVGVPAGSLMPVRVARLWSTGTVATDVIGFY